MTIKIMRKRIDYTVVLLPATEDEIYKALSKTKSNKRWYPEFREAGKHHKEYWLLSNYPYELRAEKNIVITPKGKVLVDQDLNWLEDISVTTME